MKNTKIFAAYLPQYHATEENNTFWGEGFTDWVGVKNSKPQFDGHIQPKYPLNDNYYDLSDWKVLRWQADLARQYGVDGFCIYHYWFKDAHVVLEKPVENLLNHSDINIEYFFTWDNNSWIRSWSNIPGNAWAPAFDKDTKKNEPEILLECDYGEEEDWITHFNYLLPFFKDRRYLKIDNCPVFQFFTDKNHNTMRKMIEKWDTLAKNNGFKGIYVSVQKPPFINKHLSPNQFIYQPMALWVRKKTIKGRIHRVFKFIKEKQGLNLIDYDAAWKEIIAVTKKNRNKKISFSGIVKYDDSPRRGSRANVIVGASPEKFKKWFSIFYKINCEANKDYLLLTAWNEWGEGAYLEPDSETEMGYLEALKEAKDSIYKASY